MNSRDRRTYRRLLAQAGIPVEVKLPRPKKVTKKRGYIRKLLTAGRIVWTGMAVVATLLAYVTLKPSISVEPYSSQDPHSPFAEQFAIQNNSFYSIYQLEPRCGIEDVRARNIKYSKFSVASILDFTSELSSGAKTTVTCKFGEFIGSPSANEYREALITLWFPYKLPFNISSCKAFTFEGKHASDETFIWTYRGSPNCPSTKLPSE